MCFLIMLYYNGNKWNISLILYCFTSILFITRFIVIVFEFLLITFCNFCLDLKNITYNHVENMCCDIQSKQYVKKCQFRIIDAYVL